MNGARACWLPGEILARRIVNLARAAVHER
jgi:hypothetical protein